MADTDNIDSRLSRVYQHDGDKKDIFDDWAPTYDHDLINEMGYVADAEACRHFQTLVTDRQARILDAGCGTGLVGSRLKQAGYANIFGSDYSTKMLEQARATDAYLSLEQHNLTQPVKTDNPYDAAIAVGVFAFSVPSAEHLVNITCSLKPGGIAIVTVNGKAWRQVDWEDKLEGFNQSYAHTQLVDVKTIEYLRTDGIDGRLLTLRRVG
ncbi:MAG: methyltransferase domain-containing protein [Gammaproteobacteria bacterium]|nr:methyltransferase domain-containing protein [Gammaproteobacteria bacterium]